MIMKEATVIEKKNVISILVTYCTDETSHFDIWNTNWFEVSDNFFQIDMTFQGIYWNAIAFLDLAAQHANPS